MQFFENQPNNLLKVATHIKKLNIEGVTSINDDIVKQFTNLQNLKIDKYCKWLFIDKCIKNLTSLTKLDIEFNWNIKSLSKLTNLRTLRIVQCNKIHDNDINTLTHLTKLNCVYTTITNNGIKKFGKFEIS